MDRSRDTLGKGSAHDRAQSSQGYILFKTKPCVGVGCRCLFRTTRVGKLLNTGDISVNSTRIDLDFNPISLLLLLYTAHPPISPALDSRLCSWPGGILVSRSLRAQGPAIIRVYPIPPPYVLVDPGRVSPRAVPPTPSDRYAN
jgi:hypothetical protein